MFAALEGEAPAGYYGLALLYALPWLKEGLQLDAFTVGCLLAGIAHVQVRPPASTPCVAGCLAPPPGSQTKIKGKHKSGGAAGQG